MNLVLKTSLKNIFGKPFRTFLVLFSIFVCSICALVCIDFVSSMKELLGGAALGLSKADCVLYSAEFDAKGFPENFPERDFLKINTNNEHLYKDIEGEFGYVTSDNLTIYGMNVEDAVKMEFIHPVTLGLYETAITAKFANDFGYKIGDKLIVHDRANKEIELTITGISENEKKNYFIKNYSAFVNEETAKILSCGKLDAGLVMVDVLDKEKEKDAVKELKEFYPSAIFIDLVEDESALADLNQMLKFFYLVFAVTFLLVIFVTASICNRIVSERMPFVGTLRSLGMSSARTGRILLLENALYAVLGSVPAVILYGILRVPALNMFMGVNSRGSFKTVIPHISLIAVAAVILGAVAIECLIPLKAILKALKTSIRDIIFDNRDTAYRFSKSGLITGLVLAVGAMVAAFFSKEITAAASCLLLSVTAVAFLFPWIFKGVAALVKKLADKKESAKWSLAAMEAVSRKSTIGSGVLCVTAAAMSVFIFSFAQSGLNSFASDDYHCDVVVDCTERTKSYRFIKDLKSVTDTELVYVISERMLLNDENIDSAENYDFCAIPDGGFKYYKAFEGLPEKIEDGTVIVNEKFAAKNGLSIGDTVKFTYNPTAVLPIVREYKIASLIKTESNLKEDTIFISEKDYKEVFRETPGLCLIKCDDPDYVAKMIKTYAVGSYSDVMTHTEIMDEQKESNAKLNAVLIGIVAVAVGMTFVGMVSNQLIGFEGRKKECAVMLSTAMNRKKLSGVLLAEMLITAFTASLIGTLIGFLMTIVVGKAASGSDALGLEIEANPVALILFFIFLVIVFTGTVLFPIRNLKKMKIAEQIKYE